MPARRLKVMLGKLAVLVSAGVIGGCATSPPGAGFGEVQNTVSARTGHWVQWRGHSVEDAAVDAVVHALLARELTADDAVQIALLNNRGLQATFEELGIAQAELVQAGLLRNPVFDLSIRIPDRRPSRTYLDFSVAEDFIDVFLVPARRKLVGAAFAQAKMKVEEEILALAAETKTAFYEYQASEQVVELRKTGLDAASAAADAAKDLHDAGNTTDLDLLGQQTLEARAKTDLVSAQAQAAEHRERLTDLMGLWGHDIDWKPAGRLPDPPETDFDPAELELLAVRQRDDLAAARQEVAIQSQALDLTRRTRFLASANLGPEAERETDGQWRIGPSLSAPIPVFDQGQAAVLRQQFMLEQSRRRYEALTEHIRSQVRTTLSRLLNARSKIRLYRLTVLPLGQKFLEQAQLHYNGMYIGVFQLLQAKREQIDAGSEYIDALRDYWVARAQLERAVGGRLPAGPAAAPASTEPAPPEPQTMPAGMDHQHHHHGG